MVDTLRNKLYVLIGRKKRLTYILIGHCNGLLIAEKYGLYACLIGKLNPQDQCINYNESRVITYRNRGKSTDVM